MAIDNPAPAERSATVADVNIPGKAGRGVAYGDDVTAHIIGAFHDVHRALGHGFLESVYVRAMAMELSLRRLHISRDAAVTVLYKGVGVGTFQANLIVEHTVVVEARAGEHLAEADSRQLLNYLRSSGKEIGLLLHFGSRASVRRVLASQEVAPGSHAPPAAPAADTTNGPDLRSRQSVDPRRDGIH